MQLLILIEGIEPGVYGVGDNRDGLAGESDWSSTDLLSQQQGHAGRRSHTGREYYR